MYDANQCHVCLIGVTHNETHSLHVSRDGDSLIGDVFGDLLPAIGYGGNLTTKGLLPSLTHPCHRGSHF